MKALGAVIMIALAGGCAAPPSNPARVDVPEVPAAMVPVNGSVIERWPNGTVRSERTYVDGRVREAVYYASDGSVVYEMQDDGDGRVSDAGK